MLGRVAGGEDLSMDEMAEALGMIMRGECNERQIALLLTALRAKGETVAEVAGAAKAMRLCMTRIHTARSPLLDTCGTGGDGSQTFNISTAAAIVASAAGATVAKHGNRSISSKSGSADVLRELGVNVDATVPQVERCLDEIGICFCFAPLFHHSMKHVAKVRRELGVPTIFNLLGPLCNPAGAEFQLVGVGKPDLRPKLAAALQMLGTKRAIVVHGSDGLDEVTLETDTAVTEIRDGILNEFTWNPHQFGLNCSGKETFQVQGPSESAEIIRGVLAGKPGPASDVVVLNAAAALWTVAGNHADMEADLTIFAERAGQSLTSGAAREKLAQLVKISHA
jgi:anthranilate phosphoribosyltransferase